MDITKLSLTELKALAFDELNKKALADNNLKVINEEMEKRYKADSDHTLTTPEAIPAPEEIKAEEPKTE